MMGSVTSVSASEDKEISSAIDAATPLMKQYFEIKKRCGDAILLFQVGDFFETFGDDAKRISKDLGIVLTKRERGGDEPIPMAGFPCHSAMNYVKRLINRGYKVAICEQVEKPSPNKKLVRREITRIITPGTVVEDELLDVGNNFFMGVLSTRDVPSCAHDNIRFAAAFVDISTGDMFITETDSDQLLSEITKFSPVECIIPRGFDEELKREIGVHCFINEVDVEFFEDAISALNRLGIDLHSPLSRRVVSATLRYISRVCMRDISHIRVRRYEMHDFMMIDATTLKNLEIFEPLRGKGGTLLSVIDRTTTPMGRRMLREWLRKPLKDASIIKERLDAVEELFRKPFVRNELAETLQNLYDMERLVSRVKLGLANARDLVALRRSLEAVSEMKKNVEFSSKMLKSILKRIDDVSEVQEIIKKAIVDDPPATLKEGYIIKDGFNAELDAIRNAKRDDERWIREFEIRERERTGINSLKVGYNDIIGYYIEVTKPNLKLVPPEYVRRQTLKNVERYSTPDLDRRSERVQSADERIKAMEYEIFCSVRDDVSKYTRRIQDTAKAIAELDVLISFADVSATNNYVKPEVHSGKDLTIKCGRHPVVELSTDFVPNDVTLDEKSRFMIITGPNASGKSTYVRMVALIAILSQIGCFVPAEEAKICIFDKILTRIGSVDEISSGISSFMVEIMEMLKIIRHASERDLVLLDEVGKGTSTYDGISIAWAFSKYLCEVGCKVLFATHFRELTELEKEEGCVVNYHFDAVESSQTLHFVRKLKRGVSERSYGIKVAEMLKMPRRIIEEAERKLEMLERTHSTHSERIKSQYEQKKCDVRERGGVGGVAAGSCVAAGSDVAAGGVGEADNVGEADKINAKIDEVIAILRDIHEKERRTTILRAIKELQLFKSERFSAFKLRRKCGEGIDHFIAKNLLFNSLENVRAYSVEAKRSAISKFGYRPDVMAITDEGLIIIEVERNIKAFIRKLRSLESALAALRRDAHETGDPILKLMRAGDFKIIVGTLKINEGDLRKLRESCSRLNLNVEVYHVHTENGEIARFI